MPKDKKNLLVFGYGLGLISVTFGIGGWVRHGFGLPVFVLFTCSIIFTSVSFFNWAALKPGYDAWMKAAHLIGGVATTIALSIVFLIIFTPAGLLLRAMGRDHLQRDFSKKNMTYWEKRQPTVFEKQRYHQQF